VTRDDHSGSRRADVLQREAPHLVAPGCYTRRPPLRLVTDDVFAWRVDTAEARLAAMRARRAADRKRRRDDRRAVFVFVVMVVAAYAAYLLVLYGLVKALT
jgi:hypothetical protein